MPHLDGKNEKNNTAPAKALSHPLLKRLYQEDRLQKTIAATQRMRRLARNPNAMIHPHLDHPYLIESIVSIYHGG